MSMQGAPLGAIVTGQMAITETMMVSEGNGYYKNIPIIRAE